MLIKTKKFTLNSFIKKLTFNIMKRFYTNIMLLLLTTITLQAQSVGLVLSGGGAKGIAHIGVIQALEDNNIPVDYITGTSMGAIVGGLYASGYSPQEMMTLLMSKDFTDWSIGVINPNLTYYFDKSEPSPAFATINFAIKDSTNTHSSIFPSSLINPIPMNFAFMELFSAYTAQCNGDFNRLFIPFRCIASDVFHKQKLVCSSGDLGEAIRASMSFPLIFKPIYKDGVPLFDGGIYDNFPVDVMRKDFAPDFIIGVDVSTASSKINVNNPVDQVEAMVIQDHGTYIPDSIGVRLNINLSKFTLLDFEKAQEIYNIGYQHAMEIIDSIKERVPTRISKNARAIARNTFKSQTPAIIFDKVEVIGTNNSSQNEYIETLFKHSKSSTFDIEEAKISYYHAISSQKLKDLIPTAHFCDSSRTFALHLQATPKNNYSAEIGGFITSSTNSMLFLGTKYSTLSMNSFDASVKAWIGQSYYAAEGSAKISLRTSFPSQISLQAVASKQKFYESDMLFYSDELPTFIINYDNHIRLSYEMAIGRKAKLDISAGYALLRDRFYPSNTSNFSTAKQDKATYTLGQAKIGITRNTLNHTTFATEGNHTAFNIIGITGDYSFIPNPANVAPANRESRKLTWIQAEFDLENYFKIAKHFTLGTKINAVASTKPLVENYTANIVQASAFCPTPATKNYFNPAFRANSYVAGGIMPIFKINEKLQLRTEFYAFAPFQKIIEGQNMKAEYGKWFDEVNYLGEASIIYRLPFATFSIYTNYLNYPSRNWNFGVNIGFPITAPKFLK